MVYPNVRTRGLAKQLGPSIETIQKFIHWYLQGMVGLEPARAVSLVSGKKLKELLWEKMQNATLNFSRFSGIS